MRIDPREAEAELRTRAQQSQVDIDPESGTVLAPKSFAQMISVRLEPELVQALRNLAEATGTTLSDLLRRGAALVLEEEAQGERPGADVDWSQATASGSYWPSQPVVRMEVAHPGASFRLLASEVIEHPMVRQGWGVGCGR